MSKVLIEEFRGFQIYLETDNGKFKIEGDDYQEYKPSYNSAKDYIKKFIKNNTVFPEFTLIPNPKYDTYKEEIKIIGINGHGRFVYNNKNNKKSQLDADGYEAKHYIFPEDLNEKGYDSNKVLRWEEEIKVLRNKIREEKTKLPEGATEKLKQIKQEFEVLWKR